MRLLGMFPPKVFASYYTTKMENRSTAVIQEEAIIHTPNPWGRHREQPYQIIFHNEVVVRLPDGCSLFCKKSPLFGTNSGFEFWKYPAAGGHMVGIKGPKFLSKPCHYLRDIELVISPAI